MTIFGTGVDIVEIERIKRLMEKNSKFRNRVFTVTEIKYCENKKKKFRHYAVRFAAKESVWKALGKGGIGLKNIEVRNMGSGKPQVFLKDRKTRKNCKVMISLAHTDNYAIAQAIVMGTK